MAEFICPNQINRDYFTVDDNGLIIPKVYPAAPSVTVSDTPTINLTKTGNDIKADVILNPSTDNLAVSTPTGIFVDKKASAITVLDTAGNYTATNVEGALAEIATKINPDNGLSIGTDGKMELGGELHKYTEILLAGNAVRFVNSSGEYIQINPSGEIEISSNGFGGGLFQKNILANQFYATYVSDAGEYIIGDENLGKTRIKINPTGTKIVNLDTTEFQFNDDGSVFFQKVSGIPTLNTPTTEHLAFDTTTGQVGIIQSMNDIYSRVFNPGVNVIDSTTGASTFTEIIWSRSTVVLNKTTKVHGSYNIDLESSNLIESGSHAMFGLVFLDGVYANMATVRYRTSDISNSGGVSKCMQLHGEFAMNIPAGTHTIGFGYVLNNGAGNNITAGSASVQHVEKTILFS